MRIGLRVALAAGIALAAFWCGAVLIGRHRPLGIDRNSRP
jgi:hypothetical protein